MFTSSKMDSTNAVAAYFQHELEAAVKSGATFWVCKKVDASVIIPPKVMDDDVQRNAYISINIWQHLHIDEIQRWAITVSTVDNVSRVCFIRDTSKIILVCGYRRSGKDTLLKQLSGHTKFNWVIRSRPGLDPSVFPSINVEGIPTELRYQQVAFANAVKKEVKAHLSLGDDFAVEAYKDTVIADGRTFRDYCIEVSMAKRQEDPDYWCRLALSNVNASKVVVTDWRFLNEEGYARSKGDVTTIRVFRSCVPIPPPTDKSEHDLDSIITDFILTLPDDWDALLKVFPQYKDYVITQ